MTITDNQFRDFGQELLDNSNFGGYLSLAEAREIRLRALTYVRIQNQELKPYRGMAADPEEVIYSQYLKDEETGEVERFTFKARLKYTTKQYFAILLNERMFYTKQELKKIISNI